MNAEEFDKKFVNASTSIMQWCKDHPKATLGIVCVVIGVVVGLLLR